MIAGQPSVRHVRTAGSFALAVFLLASAPLQALAGNIALVIGNGAYEHSAPLANPRNDATAIAAKLRLLGFETVEGYDLTRDEMADKVREFSGHAREADLSLFFYAGHGLQVDGENYLLPVDAVMVDETAIDFEAFPVEMITRQMSYTKGANIIILDACRDNPLAEQLSRSLGDSSRSIGKSGALAAMDVTDNGRGTGIAFATSPGEVAADGDGEHSPFTEALLRHIGTPNLPITSIMSRVTGEVYEATGQQQRPWFNQSFTGDVVLYTAALPEPEIAAAEPAAGSAPAAQSSEDERFMFETARDSGHLEDYQIYLEFYPNGRYAPFARSAIERLEAEARQDPVAAEPAVATASRSVPASGAAEYDPNAPLVLVVTAEVRNAPATQVTEQGLFLDREKLREVQARLNASGIDVGWPDGVVGPNTRSGISSWQMTNGLPPTGYLNALQFQLLTSQTEATFATYLAAPKAAAPVAAASSNRPKTASTQTTAQKKTSNTSQGQSQTSGSLPQPIQNFLNDFGQQSGQNLANRIFGN